MTLFAALTRNTGSQIHAHPRSLIDLLHEADIVFFAPRSQQRMQKFHFGREENRSDDGFSLSSQLTAGRLLVLGAVSVLDGKGQFIRLRWTENMGFLSVLSNFRP